MEDKKSFLLYTDLVHTVKKLPNEQAGELFKHILSYVNDENPTTNNTIIELVFEPIKQQLKRDLRRWESIAEKRREAGRVGGLKSGETRRIEANEANEASALKTKQTKQSQANEAVNVNGNVNGNVKNNINNVFEAFRLEFPGIKRSLKTELDNFLKRNSPEVAPLLLPALEKEKRHRKKTEQQNGFIPQWKNLSTWINQRCWEQEFTEPPTQKQTAAPIYPDANDPDFKP